MSNDFSGKFSAISGAIFAALAALAPAPAHAQAEPFLGQLMVTGANFCPRGWAPADGQILAINQHTALFSLLGTIYGGNGTTTFQLPDLRGRAPIHEGQGIGLSPYNLGEIGGSESFTLLTNNMPVHTHQVMATWYIADKSGPGDKLLASNTESFQYHEGPPNRTMDPSMITPSGGSQPVFKRSPFLAMTWCIALEGIYPSRE